MGEATYQIRARFETPEQAKRVSEELDALMQQMDKAYDFWQSNRGTGKFVDKKWVEDAGPGREAFWKDFKEKFPLVYNFLSEDVRDGDHNNGLAGELSYTDSYEIDSIEVEDTLVTYTAVVWHFANWTPLVEWFESKRSIRCEYVSDEYADPFEALSEV